MHEPLVSFIWMLDTNIRVDQDLVIIIVGTSLYRLSYGNFTYKLL